MKNIGRVRNYRLVLIDTLGFGHSPKPDIAYSLDEYPNAISDTLEALRTAGRRDPSRPHLSEMYHLHRPGIRNPERCSKEVKPGPEYAALRESSRRRTPGNDPLHPRPDWLSRRLGRELSGA